MARSGTGYTYYIDRDHDLVRSWKGGATEIWSGKTKAWRAFAVDTYHDAHEITPEQAKDLGGGPECLSAEPPSWISRKPAGA